jgi:hypothetical protein
MSINLALAINASIVRLVTATTTMTDNDNDNDNDSEKNKQHPASFTCS